MELEVRTLRKSINKAFLKEAVDRSSFNHFKGKLGQLLSNVASAEEKSEHEEHFKNFLVPFFNEVGFDDYYINTSVRIDLAVHTGDKVTDPVGLLLEVKRPSNKSEMISETSFNRKAMHEAVLYYLEQRLEEDNDDLKHVIITDTLNWFVFDAQEFERCFYKSSALRNVYKSWKDDQKVSSNNDFMYDKIAGYIDDQASTLRGLHLNLKEYGNLLEAKEGSDQEKKLIPLFKFFSPTYLLKEPFANDSNTLNREFYRELLYILGLEEVKDGSTRFIERAGDDSRNPGSLIENTIRILETEDHLSTVSEPKVKYGSDRSDQLFNVALELSIVWMNRVLFLKLLEAQLFCYHRQDKKFKFLNAKTIDDYDELNKLFFQVLARRETDRPDDVNEKFGHIPFLNSSLFDPSKLEHETVFISNLDDKKTIPVYSRSVLKEQRGKEINTLQYLFEFLDAYDFAAEGGEEIQQERKTLINASVLGLIFEKINGYKDGSFFTPGFITEYMARETLRKAVTDKFTDHLGQENLSFTDIYNRIGRDLSIAEANDIVNAIATCDPAVGSGHFLVSCLNELLAIKSDLGILCDREGKRLRGVTVEIENDELIVTWGDEELFEYDVAHTWQGNTLAERKIAPERQRIQKALFHEKRHIIENCLFGVDINPNSVKICRLRLWIELLKNTYYNDRSNHTELEVLPNIDINIKSGNSLVSRFELDSDLAAVFKESEHSLEDYKEAVRNYKHSGDREEKQRLQQLIDDIKEEYSTTLLNNRPINKKLSKQRGRLELMQNADLFGDKKFTKKEIKKQEKKVRKLEDQKAEEESGAFFNEAFEWRFEFPEVLDEDGLFVGFDVIVANPPYIRIQDLRKSDSSLVEYINHTFETAGKGNYDLYIPFFELASKLLSEVGLLCYINPHKFANANYGEGLRLYLSSKKLLDRIIHFGTNQIFEEATTYTALFFASLQPTEEIQYYKPDNPKEITKLNDDRYEVIPSDILTQENWSFITGREAKLYKKLVSYEKTLEDITERIFQGLKTSADAIYIVEKRNELEDLFIIYSNQNEKEFEVEKALFHPLIKGGDSEAYSLKNTDKLILFPYSDSEIIEWDQIEANYPKTAKYLSLNKEYLENRESGRFKGENWHQFGRNQAIDIISCSKLFTPDIAPQPRFSFDAKGDVYFTGGVSGGYGIIPINEVSFNILLGILNSKLIWWFISKTSTRMRGDWLSFESRYISPIPFPSLDNTTVNEIETFVDEILTVKRGDPEAETSELEAEIDRRVYELYGLSEEEIGIVEKNLNDQ